VYDAATLDFLTLGLEITERTFYRAAGDGPYEPCTADDLIGVPYQYEEGGSRAAGVALLVIRK
jgi:hypothetical protein